MRATPLSTSMHSSAVALHWSKHPVHTHPKLLSHVLRREPQVEQEVGKERRLSPMTSTRSGAVVSHWRRGIASIFAAPFSGCFHPPHRPRTVHAEYGWRGK